MTPSDARPTRRAVLGAALSHPDLRRVAATFCCFRTCEVGAWIAIIAEAHQRGGVRESAAVMASQLAPAALAAFAVSGLVDRFGVDRVLRSGLAVQSAGLFAVAALIGADAPSVLIYAAAVVTAVAVVTSRPTIATLLPELVSDPHELTAANAVIGWLDGASSLLGPLVAAIALELIGSWFAFVAFGVLYLVGALVAPRLDPSSRPVGHERKRMAEPDRVPGQPADRGWRGVGPVLVVLAGHAFMIGALDLLFVIVAVDVTGGPPARTAWLNTAFGVGALIGGGASVLLIGRRRLWPAVTVAGFATAALLALVGLSDDADLAALTLALCGLASAGLFVSARTLLQRVCDLRLLCRAFSLAEAFEMTLLLVGAVTVPFVVAGVGDRWAPVGIGAIMAVVLAVALRPMARSEGRVVVSVDRIRQLQAVELFAGVPAATLETLARQARPTTAQMGEPIVVQGEIGHAYFVLVSGGAEVAVDGQVVNRLAAGHGFGELALLYDIPRTATVTATEPCHLLVIDRWAFLVAVSLGAEPRYADFHGVD
jgi:MFS family permease